MGLKSRKKRKEWLKGLPRRPDLNFDRRLIELYATKTSSSPLPIVHVTAAWPAKEIIRCGKLTTHNCDVFPEDKLLYFFVLRPAYCSKIGSQKSHHISRFPVAFILQPEALHDPYHVYPFDTGGAAKGAFSDVADIYVPLEDYALEPKHEAAASFIKWAFGSLEEYYEGRLRSGLEAEIQDNNSVAVGYISIAQLGVCGNPNHDLRASTIEMAASHNIDLENNVRLIILPKQYLEDNDALWNDIAPFLKAGTAIETYDWQPNRAPDEFQQDLLRITREWYRREKIMS